MRSSAVIGCQTSAGERRCGCGDESAILAPGMEHAKEAVLRAEMFVIGGDLHWRCGGAGSEQEE
jgi:hypothetical protein